jgi:hypothetical protein
VGDHKIGGVFRAQGVLGADAQRLVRMHCERGNVQEMVEKVADAVLADAIAKGRVPPNAGVKTKDLLERTEAALYVEVESYHAKGGILTAKGFVSIQGLVAEMAKQWLRGFAPPIPTETVVKGTLSDPEIQERLTVVALKLRKLILMNSNVLPDPSLAGYHIPEEKLEGLCTSAAVAMFMAFQEPNEANHEIIHGEEP